MQETFLCAWNRIGAFEAGNSIGPWLLAIARERAIDYLSASGHEHDALALEPTGFAEPPDAPAPSPRLRRRLLAAAGAEERRFGAAPFLAGALALALFAAFYFSTRENQFANETLMLRDQLRRQSIEVTRFNEAIAILGSPGTSEVGFGQESTGKVFVNAQRGILLIASNLPPAPDGKIYEAWAIPNGGKPIPAGLFPSNPTGATVHVHPGPVAAGIHTITVTLEPAQGSDQPTNTPLLTASLPYPAVFWWRTARWAPCSIPAAYSSTAASTSSASPRLTWCGRFTRNM
jgi:hypothetical protein